MQSLIARDKKLKETEDALGRRPLHLAAVRGDLRILEFLLNQKSKVNTKNKQNQTRFISRSTPAMMKPPAL